MNIKHKVKTKYFLCYVSNVDYYNKSFCAELRNGFNFSFLSIHLKHRGTYLIIAVDKRCCFKQQKQFYNNLWHQPNMIFTRQSNEL